MVVTDAIADFLTRIRNANMVMIHPLAGRLQLISQLARILQDHSISLNSS